MFIHHSKILLLFTLIIASLSPALFAAADGNTKVYHWEEGEPVAKAKLEILDWMQGSWRWRGPVGDMLGGELLVSARQHGQVLATARGFTETAVVMNEIVTKTQVGDSIEIAVRHMDHDLHSWEPLDKPTIHKLLKVDTNHFYFDDYTLVKQDNNHYTLYLRIYNAEGKPEIVVVTHERTK